MAKKCQPLQSWNRHARYLRSTLSTFRFPLLGVFLALRFLAMWLPLSFHHFATVQPTAKDGQYCRKPKCLSDYHKDQTIDTKVLSVLVTTNTAETVQNAFTALTAGSDYEQHSTKAGKSSAADCG